MFQSIVFVFFLGFSFIVFAKDVSIAVIAFSGEEHAKKTWQPTLNYLNKSLPQHHFSLTPIEPDSHQNIDKLVQTKQVDFVIAQPVVFVELQVRRNATSMLTLVDSSKLAEFGSVIFVRADSDINLLTDISGRSIAGASPKGLGGWLIAYSELLNAGVEINQSSDVSFLGVQENTVKAVLDGSIEVGVVRTGLLEKFFIDNDADISSVKVINGKQVKDFPYLLSTELYPEWVFAKASHTSSLLAKQVATILLQMPAGSKEARARGYWEWVTPIDYQPIHELMKRLKVGVYHDFGRVGFLQYIQTNLALSMSFLVLLVVLFATGLWILKLNKRLKAINFSIEQQNNMILDSVSEGIYGVDLKGNCTFINKSLTDITGWNRQDMLGKHQHEILHHTHADGTPHPSDQCPVYATFGDGVARFIDQDAFWKKNGNSFIVEYSVTPVKDKFNNITGSVVVFKDITIQMEQKKLQQKNAQQFEHMARLNSMGEIVTSIAHELSQPLTAMSTVSFSGMKLVESNKYTAKKLLTIFKSLTDQSEHAAAVIKHLRDMSSGRQTDFTLIDVNRRIERVMILLNSMVKDHHICVSLKLDSNLPKAPAQAVQIDQVILNLCKNAIDAMMNAEGERHLTISSKCIDSAIEISIMDSGQGIDLEIKDELFDAFSTHQDDGMGLGLSISRSIIERHYGKLYLASSSKQGALFKFTLPIR